MCVGIPGRILQVAEGPQRMGRVDFREVIRDVSLALVPEAGVGDYVLVNLGSAVQVMSEAEAEEVLDVLDDFARFLEEDQMGRPGLRDVAGLRGAGPQAGPIP